MELPKFEVAENPPESWFRGQVYQCSITAGSASFLFTGVGFCPWWFSDNTSQLCKIHFKILGDPMVVYAPVEDAAAIVPALL